MMADSIGTHSAYPATGPRLVAIDGDATEQTMMKPTASDPAEGPRPSIPRTWHTERPLSTAELPIGSSEMARHRTNISALDEAIRADVQDNDDTSSISSSPSSSSDEEPPKPKDTHRRGYTRQGRERGGYGGSFSRFNVGNENYRTKGRVCKKDGRLNIRINENNDRGYLAKALGGPFLKRLGPAECEPVCAVTQKPVTSDLPPPKLNIVVMVIGSRGDIQPFLKLGKRLQEYGHRVRIATHPAFKDFVQEAPGLEFFSVGGDPAELMAFMVKNPGMIPTMDTLKKGQVGRRRSQMAEMFEGFWRACINATDDEHNEANRKMMSVKAPFIADAIIANPPSFAHVHCAERLGIPLHLMFTFPYTPTQAFPHPLANVKKTNLDLEYVNLMSYPLVEMMTWQGLGDLINNFRVNTMGLEPVSTLWAPGQLYRLKVPFTYLWSPALVPKPQDWGREIDIAGFVFLDLASSFKPPEELSNFLNSGEPPIYIGFGSVVVDDPDNFTRMIFEAVEKAGVRALVSKGWGGLGDGSNIPDNIYMLGNTPHDWLFPRVQAVVHHGGAGTTAIGLKCGKPTMIVPFFGDQQFWGSMIVRAGAGPDPVPYKRLTADKLAEGIEKCLTDDAKQSAQNLAESIEAEGDGVENAVASFHGQLPLRGENSMRCSILEDRVAVWRMKSFDLRLSALAADLLVEKRKLNWKQLRLIRHNEWNDFEGPGEPLTGGATAIAGTVTGIATGIGSVPFRVARTARKREKQEERKKRNGKSPAKQSGNGSAATTNDKDQSLLNKDEPNHNGNADKEGEKAASHEAQGTKHDNESIVSNNAKDPFARELAQDVGKGVGQTTEALVQLPMNLSLAIAQGFHNAPRLYGDITVRRPTRISGLKSGLRASRNEFVFGIYDGVTGLVVHPYTGARDNGPVGLVKGIGMGLTGFVLKDLAAIIGPIAYTLKGVQKELSKSKQPTKFIRKAKILQGHLDHQELTELELNEAKWLVSHGWSVMQQVSDVMDSQFQKGLHSKIRFIKHQKKLKGDGGFENVERAEKALKAWNRYKGLDGSATEQRKPAKKPEQNNQGTPEDGDVELVKQKGAQANQFVDSR